MTRYIDANVLYEKTAEWEASALLKIEELNRIPLEEMTDEERAEWRRWTAILGERTAFKHDVADAPTVDAVEVTRCKYCKWFPKFAEDEINIAIQFRCKKMNMFYSINHFCASGERRDDAETIR